MAQTGNKKINSVAKPGKTIKNNIVEKLNWYSHFEKTIFPKRKKGIRTKLGVKVKIMPYKIAIKILLFRLYSLKTNVKETYAIWKSHPRLVSPNL